LPKGLAGRYVEIFDYFDKPPKIKRRIGCFNGISFIVLEPLIDKVWESSFYNEGTTLRP
jgi:hypothetical protein